MEVYMCPCCNGAGTVSRPPWVAGDQETWASTDVRTYPCQACAGAGVLWKAGETRKMPIDLGHWPKMMGCALMCLALAAPASAQINQFPDAASNWTLGGIAAIEGAEVLQCRDSARCAEMQATRLLGTFATVYILKSLIKSKRPCAPDCGVYAPDANMPSGHTAFAFAMMGRTHYAGFTIPLGVLTAIMRGDAKAHDAWGILGGASIGIGWSFVNDKGAR